MVPTTRSALRIACLACLVAGAVAVFRTSSAPAVPNPETYWNVDDVRPGMKGVGRTVMKGTRIEPFDAEVLGVLKNTSPGRDLVLCRLSGLDLERTGVIAGMSGSPIYIEGKLLGAVAYAWAFGKDPIAGITPFSQMHSAAEAYERRDLAQQPASTRLGLGKPVTIGGKSFDKVTVAASFDDPTPTAADGLWMVPLRTPVAATGFTPGSLALLRDCFRESGLVPVQGGAVTARVSEREKEVKLEPGGPLAVSLVSGDFDMSGIGTVTHIEGERVYGWGHPFYGMGACDFPLMTGYIHTVYPRQTVSFKMGSPLKTVGVINADVSTGIAGWLGRTPDLLPMRMTVRRENADRKTFNVQVVRQRQMLPSLVYASLNNSVDMEGDLPEELTATLTARIEVEGRPPVVIEDTFSGSMYSGARAAPMMYHTVASAIAQLTYNTFEPVRINKVECDTQITPGRRTADIEGVELASETYAPGETLRVAVQLRPYKGPLERVPVTLKLPADMAEGTYTVTLCDDTTAIRAELRENPLLYNPQDLDQVFQALELQNKARRTNLVVRVPVPAGGVAVNGKQLPNLPPSMVKIIGDTRRTGAQVMTRSLVARHATGWVVQGAESVQFTVAKNKKVGLPIPD